MLLMYQHLNNDELTQAYLLKAWLLHLYVLPFAQSCDVP
jgi:hypothetical protein